MLSKDAVERRLVGEQVSVLYGQGPAVFLGSGFSAAILVWLLWDEPVERRHLAGWLTVLALVMAARWFGTLRYRADPRSMERGAFWGWMFTLGAVFAGVVWGYVGVGFFQPTLLFLFPIALVLAGQVALSVPSVGMFFPAHAAFNLFAMTPFMVRNYFEEGRLFVGQSFAILVFMIVCLAFAWRQQAMIRNAIRLRLENEGLLARLTQENRRADEARRQAEDANAAKTRFLAAAGHDLRQPLQAMTLFTEAVAQSVASAELPPPVLVDKLRLSCASLGALLDSLLDLSRAEAGAIKPEIGAVPLQPLFDGIRREFADQARAKGLRLRVVPTRAVVRSDAVLLARVLRNLTSNALRYTESGGVLVGCRRRGGQLRIEVRDSGIGIPEEARDEVFREFHQLGNPERDRHKGLGLGLAIVNALARQLGHEVRLESTPGRGSVFAVELAAAEAEIDTASVAPELPDRLRGRLFAVIEDEAMIREALAGLLSSWGCEVVAGETAADVLARLGQRAPDAILADWRLRECHSGADEIASICTRFGRSIPAVLVTGDTAPDAVRDAAYRVLRKPVQGFRLRAELDALIGADERTSPIV